MAIKVNGQTVIDDSRQLTNIASVDSTTVAALGTAGVGGGSKDFVATGSIPNGALVGLLSDGTVSVITTFKTDYVYYETQTVNYVSATYDTSANKVLVIYSDWDNSQILVARIGTVSNGDITFGSKITVDGDSYMYQNFAEFDPNTEQTVVYYYDYWLARMKARVLSISGSTLSVGSATIVNTDSTNSHTAFGMGIDPSTGKVLVSYAHNSGYTRAHVGTISGSSISFGSGVTLNNLYGYASNLSTTFDTANNKFVALFKNNNDNRGYARVGTVSGSSVSFGSSTQFNTANVKNIKSVYDPQSGKTLITYYDNDSGSQKFILGTVSGTSISFSSPVELDTGDYTINTGLAGVSLYHDPIVGKNYVQWDSPSQSRLFQNELVVSGSSLSIGNPLDMGATTIYMQHVHDPDSNRIVVLARGVSFLVNNNSNDGAIVGLGNGTIADGGTINVTTVGGTNSNQTGLTTGKTYYMQSSGSLGTAETADKIGIALSSTSMFMV